VLREGLMKGELVKGTLRIREECNKGVVIMWLEGVMIQISIEGE
jgi:hypothetical protein